ncbi:MAG: hypothetical protein ACT4NL_15750 [Pseudomarimonas sp.]
MLDSVLLVLREVLEAALFISLLFALCSKLGLDRRWGTAAIIGGLLCSWLLSHFAYAIAEAGEGVGQELVNALLYAIAILCFMLLNAILLPHLWATRLQEAVIAKRLTQSTAIHGLSALVVACSIAREGSEVWIYLSGFSLEWEALASALMGGLVGAGIGMSLGSLVYYGFAFMRDRYFFPLFVVLTSLVIGGLAMQVAKQFMQIGWLDSGRPVWDTTWLVDERSWIGEMLRALFGYDANPDRTQAMCYFGALAISLLIISANWAWQRRATHV